MFKDICQGHTVDNAHGYLADDPGLYDFGGYPFCERKEEEERYDNQDLND